LGVSIRPKNTQNLKISRRECVFGKRFLYVGRSEAVAGEDSFANKKNPGRGLFFDMFLSMLLNFPAFRIEMQLRRFTWAGRGGILAALEHIC
jgi:hypothetical protein